MKEEIIFVGSFVSFIDSKTSPSFSQAANLYQGKFIDFIQPQLSISILPIFYRAKSNFTFHRPVYFINNQSIFKNKINYLYRFITDTVEAFLLIRKNKVPNVFFYNLDYQNSLLVVLVKFLLKRKVYVIVADYNHYTTSIISNIFNRIFKRLNGVITLNSNIQCNSNSMLLPGLVSSNAISIDNSTHLNRNVILSGSLGHTTGLNLALDFFSKNPGYHLYISGKPFRLEEVEFLSMMERYGRLYPNIHFLGLLGYEEYLQVLSKCDVALSLRNPDHKEHDFNFPSKILEYLSKSKIVLSTKTYKDIPESFLFYSGFDCKSMADVFTRIYMLQPEEIIKRRYDIYKYLNENFTEAKVVQVVNALISSGSGR